MDDEENDKVESGMVSVAAGEQGDPSQASAGPVGTIPVHFFQQAMFVSHERPAMAVDFFSTVDNKPSTNGVSRVPDGFSPLMAQGDSRCLVPVLSTPEQRKSFFLGLINELVEECTICIAFLVHRREKRDLYARANGSKAEETLIDEPGYDVFGNRLTRGCLSRAYQLTKIECECPVCHLPKCALRFAPHLEKCMGLGRDSRRRAVADGSASKTTNEVCVSYGIGSDVDEQKSSGEVDEEWLPAQEKWRKRKANARAAGRKKNAVQAPRIRKRCQKAASNGGWSSARAKQKSRGPSAAPSVEQSAATGIEGAVDRPITSSRSEGASAGCSSNSVPRPSGSDDSESLGKATSIPEDDSEKAGGISPIEFPVMFGKVDDSEQVALKGGGYRATP